MSSKQVSSVAAAGISISLLIVGMVVGFLSANYLNRQETANQVSSSGPGASAEGGVPVSQLGAPGGMMPDVAAAIEKAKSNPADFDSQMQVAEMYLQIQRADKAQEFLDTAAKIDGLDADRTVRLANAYFDVRQFDAARPLYLRAVEQRPDDINIRADLGVTFMEGASPDFDRAFKEFDIALKLNPRHEPTLFNLGIAHLKKGDLELADKTLTRLENATPGNELAGRLKQAIEQARK